MAFHMALNNGQNQGGANGAVPGVQDAQLNGQAGQGGQQAPAARGAMRYINLGPIRLGFAQGGQEVADLANRMGVELNDAAQVPRTVNNPIAPVDLSTMEAVRNRLVEVDQRIQQEVRDIQQGLQSVQTAQQEVTMMNLLLAELARIRHNQGLNQGQQHAPTPDAPGLIRQGGPGLPAHAIPAYYPPGSSPWDNSGLRMNTPVTRHGASANATAIPAGSPDLPEGVVLPQGWSLLPLQRMDQRTAANGAPIPAGLGVQVNVHDPIPQPGVAPAPSSGFGDNATLDSSETPAPSHISTEPVTAEGPQVEVAAPTPVTPNWGGQAQLFGGINDSSNSLPRGAQTGGSSRSVSETRDMTQQVQASGSRDNEQKGSSSVAAAAEGEHSESSSKGKAPAAATVEDAEDES